MYILISSIKFYKFIILLSHYIYCKKYLIKLYILNIISVYLFI
jgi:hypothetical protein